MNQFLEDLSPTQEHFLKRFLVEKRLSYELLSLNSPDALKIFGLPFKSTSSDPDAFPLLRYFFNQYVASFPFITNNTAKEQQKFWQDTVQPFVESFNAKQLSNSNDRKEHTTKRHQINSKFLSGLSLFFNLMLVTKKDLVYLEGDHLKPSDIGKLDKIKAHKTPMLEDVGETMEFTNGLNLNVVCVDSVEVTEKGWLGFSGSTHHYEFVIQVTKEENHEVHYVSRAYHKFKELEKALQKKFPGIMKIETSSLPEKFKNDTNALVKEKLRVSLRGYLNLLIKFPEIVHGDDILIFLFMNKFSELNEGQKKDRDLRKKHEKRIIQTQIEFQKEVGKIMIDFSKRFDDFKAQLIKEPNTLVKIFEEIGEKEEMVNLSPLLKIFIDWCKIEVSATVFQVFLSQDNSNELLSNCRKFHRLFPYTVMYNILRFTNPMSIISKVINLLLISPPGSKKNLLSMIFITLLDEDLSGYEKEIQEIKVKLAQFPNFIEAIEQFIDENRNEPHDDIDTLIPEIIRTVKNPTTKEEKVRASLPGDIFNDLKQLYQLKIRQNDKLILKSLWQEPELTRLIKNFLIIFYQPLIHLLSKSKMHIFFRDLEKFNTELLDLLVKLNEEEIYYLNSAEIFNKIMKLVDTHIVTFWKFVHNMYVNDDKKLFLNLIKWIENFLLKLRMKYHEPEKVTLNLLMSDVELDKDLFLKQLQERMDLILLKRKLYKEHFQQQQNKSQNTIEKKWDDIHNSVMDYDGDFGLDIEELQELNFDINNEDDQEFQKKLNQILKLKYSDSELAKFDNHLVQELRRVLKA